MMECARTRCPAATCAPAPSCLGGRVHACRPCTLIRRDPRVAGAQVGGREYNAHLPVHLAPVRVCSRSARPLHRQDCRPVACVRSHGVTLVCCRRPPMHGARGRMWKKAHRLAAASASPSHHHASPSHHPASADSRACIQPLHYIASSPCIALHAEPPRLLGRAVLCCAALLCLAGISSVRRWPSR